MKTWQNPTMTVVASLADAELGPGIDKIDFKKKKDKKTSP